MLLLKWGLHLDDKVSMSAPSGIFNSHFLFPQFQTQSLRITDLHRKSHLWRGVVSITLIEGQDLKAMDANGLSDPYVKFRLGHQKYKSKVNERLFTVIIFLDNMSKID